MSQSGTAMEPCLLMPPFPYWLGLGFVLALVAQLVGVVVGTDEGGRILWQNIVFTVQSSAPTTLVGLLIAILGQRTAASQRRKRSMGRSPAAWLNAVLAVVLAGLLLTSAVVFEAELRADQAEQQQVMIEHVESLEQELEQVQLPEFIDQLQDPEFLASVRAGLPPSASLSASAGAGEVATALQALIRSDLEDVRSEAAGAGSMMARRQWGARFFEAVPVLVFAGAAILLAVEALR